MVLYKLRLFADEVACRSQQDEDNLEIVETAKFRAAMTSSLKRRLPKHEGKHMCLGFTCLELLVSFKFFATIKA